MKAEIALMLLCLAVASQGRVLQPLKETLEPIPVTVIQETDQLNKLEAEVKPAEVAEKKLEPVKATEEQLPKLAKAEDVKPEQEPEQPLIVEQPEVKPKLEEVKPKLEEEPKREPEAKRSEEPKPETEPKLLLETKPELEQPKLELENKPEQQPKLEKDDKPEQQLKLEQPTLEQEIQPEQLPKQEQPKLEQETKLEPEPAQPILKSLPTEDVAETVAEVVDPVVAVVPEPAETQDAVQPNLRQVTQATPTQQSTTQQNFVQQLIQNSPIGAFLNQLSGQQQPAPVQPQPLQPLSDEPTAPVAPPAPTVPGFLNPATAITSAQTAVQNAAQSVVNTTTQAFQGIQQFANNLGAQLQNTLSGLTGQQQNAQPTTPRPPGPIQSFVNNVFGGGNNNNATAAAPAQSQPQGGGPFQGIINFLGGNRPQSAPVAPVAAAPAPAITQSPSKKPDVDDKIDPAPEANDQLTDADNEVRSSAEATDDSFEEAVPVNEVIVVNDDAGGSVADDDDDGAVALAAPVAGLPVVPANSVEPEQQAAQPVDAVPL